MIEVKDLQVWYGHGAARRRVVHGVSLAVEPGQSFGLVGESGSGKSTVLRALAGLLTDWSGEIRVEGEAQGRRRSRAFFRRVQMVFQDPYGSLHPRHTVERILSEPARLHHLPEPARRVDAALEEVGLGAAFRYRYPHQLSGGQRQRVAIARALILRPKVLLLDEPTSALDVSIQAEILNLLSRLRRELGPTFLFVSHDLAVVSHMCSRLAVMKEGRFVEEMPVERLRRARPSHPYSRALMRASVGYERAAPAGA